MSNIDLKKISILIPSLDPDINMVNYINELVSNDVRNIIVINDGGIAPASVYTIDGDTK